MEPRLIVIRSNQPEKLVDFYSLLGCTFEYHRHGNSPMHYSSAIGNLIFEIYPLSKNQAEADNSTRLGFAVNNFEDILKTLSTHQISFSEPIQTDYGYLTVTKDPDGRKIELYRK